ncbi:Flavin monooxygenase-like protein [Metarhizium guizhouense ARSEF 977]|uniref:Flavin monooxygenase-like protein n=1 Tax=Metarhizium guizhouense (strain ARSEF 977) TaxID=1276136 RepID=A0A0B4GFL9_METGA|nr:Flavin monooxygenase-like protein [Metarhizium guizhouense ARSEF 977]
MSARQDYDVIVIGAGWYGLAAARTYIELHPHDKIAILEADSTCGGTWSKDRLYPGLKSNNLYGSYEYPDFPMTQDVYGVKPGQHIPARVLHQYLTDFATKFGVLERTRFNTRVDALEATAQNSWIVYTSPSKATADPGPPEILHAKRVIIASGLTSQPNIPHYPGQDSLESTFFHAKDFCEQRDTVKTAKRAVVIGAGKSALDCAYAFATDGGNAQVDLVIRPSGQGPVWLCPAHVTPLKRATEELLNTRLLTWFSPCPWGSEDGYSLARRFLHGTTVGRFLTRTFWRLLSADVIRANGYDGHPELVKLKPWQSVFWTGSGVGIHNYPSNFFHLVKEGKIRVHVAHVSKVGGKKMYLSDGNVLSDVDVVVCATGWDKKSGIKFVNFHPRASLAHMPEEKKDALVSQADDCILSSFPLLREQPALRGAPKKVEPLRNYRFIVPLDHVSSRNIAYAGMVSTVSTTMFANAQALWISAFFDGKLRREPGSQADVMHEVLLHTEFGKWRYPCGYGAELPDFAFDSVPYVDLLLNDLGLKVHRKQSWLMELVAPYKPRDYRGLMEEWQEAQG